ncbi:hypothetical protein F5Y09DRAFT_183901 [Xylaria sp. FL1042]|nr:hypothetical protein F5Y09DRAFT_183901 [Xylaria sp. FL1042]
MPRTSFGKFVRASATLFQMTIADYLLSTRALRPCSEPSVGRSLSTVTTPTSSPSVAIGYTSSPNASIHSLKLLKIFVSSNPRYAAIAWGAIRLVFLLASNHAEFIENMPRENGQLPSIIRTIGRRAHQQS